MALSKIKVNTIYNGLLVFSQIVLPIITFPYISRVLGPHYLGDVNFIDSICQTIILIAALGIPIYGVREMAKVKHDNNESKKLLFELIFIQAIGTLFLLIGYLFLFTFLNKGQQNLFLISLIAIISQIFLVEWYYQGKEEFKYICLRSLTLRILSVISIFYFVKTQSDYYIYYLIVCLTVFINALINFKNLFKINHRLIGTLDFKKHFKPLIYILSSTLAVSIYIYIDNALLGFMTSTEYVGYYSVAIKICRLALVTVTALSIVLIPQISEAFKAYDLDRIQYLLNKSLSYVSIVGTIGMCLIFVFSKEIILLISGEAFVPAQLSLKILSPIVLLIGINNIYGFQILTTLGHEKYFMKSVLIGMSISILLNIILIPILKHVGTSLSSLITESVVTFLTIYYTRKKTQIKLSLTPVLHYLVTAIISVGIISITINLFVFAPLIKLIIGTTLSVSLYLGILIIIIKDKFILIHFKSILKLK
jgi:O-antigen/teichoic acid export membrane protein